MDVTYVDENSMRGTAAARYCNCKNDCSCGEENEHEWEWETPVATKTVQLSKMNLEVNFNPDYSSGTSAVRGNQPLRNGRHHYWEVKMITQVYGTDIMIGVGTGKVDLESATYTYSSFLGRDSESWGLSYKGNIQHDGITTPYGVRFTKGSLIGVHLDTWRGFLEFYVNRKPFGIAYKGLRGLELYPMISSTAARSKLRLTCSSSIPVSLQLECYAVLTPRLKATLAEMFPGLRHLTGSIFANMIRRNYDSNDDKLFDDFTGMDEFDVALVGFKKMNSMLGEDHGSMPGTARRECEMCGSRTSILCVPPLCTTCNDY